MVSIVVVLVKKDRAQQGANLRTQLLRRNYTPLDQTVCFIADGGLETVRYEPWYLFLDDDGLLPHRLIESERLIGILASCPRVWHNLHKRYQVRWIERMSDQDSSRVLLTIGDKLGRGQSRRGGGDDNVVASLGVQGREEIALELQALWCILRICMFQYRCRNIEREVECDTS